MTKGNTGIVRKLIDECVIMCREQRAALDCVAQLADDSTGDRIAVVGGCTTT